MNHCPPSFPARLIGLLAAITIALTATGCQQPTNVAHESREYRLVLLGGTKVGHIVETRTVADDTVVTKTDITMELRRGEATVTTEASTEEVETTDGRPVSFHSIDKANGKKVQEAWGAISEGQLELRVWDLSGTVTKSLPWPQDAVFTEGADLLLKRTGLAEGSSFSYTTFSATTLSFLPIDVNVGAAESVELLDGQAMLTTVQSTVAGMAIVNYYDADFRDLKQVTEMLGQSFVIFLCDEQTALAPAEPVDLLAIGTIACPARLDARTRARPLTYRLRLKGTDQLDIPSDDRQQVATGDDGSLLVTIAPIRQPIGRRLGYHSDDPTALAALAPSPYVQSDDERIIALTERALGDIDDALKAARRLEAFVHTYVESTMADIAFDSAATVYETKRGDCTEHAVLLAAMCRAAGIPAQIVTGLAYADAADTETPRFISHAWVRVYIADRWMHLDATSRYVDGGYIMLTASHTVDATRFKSARTFGYFDIVQVITPDAVYGSADPPAPPADP